MTSIDNTSKQMQDPGEQAALLGEALLFGSSAPIERQERDGQRQLVNSDRLPSKFDGDRAEWEALGFTFGDPDPDDPMFMPATLPPGWEREGSDHAMWSYITDTLGRQRVGIFYKAAFYDRSAHMYVIGLWRYVTDHVEYGKPLVFDDEWATREAVAAAMREIRGRHAAEAVDFCRFAADVEHRDEANRRHCAELAEREHEQAAKYNAALVALAGDAE